jgi:hypothetical protein
MQNVRYALTENKASLPIEQKAGWTPEIVENLAPFGTRIAIGRQIITWI